MSATPHNPLGDGLPRELAPGVFWLGSCLKYTATLNGYPLIVNDSAYLVTGTEASLLVDTGHPGRFDALQAQIETVLGDGHPPLRYAFGTHWEPPHGGGTARLLEAYPEARFCGDRSDFAMLYPWFADRTMTLEIGDALDLGGRQFVVQPAPLCDFRSTVWGFDTSTRTLFCSDGVAYGHNHAAHQCGKTAEEVGDALDVAAGAARFGDIAFYWSQFVDVEPYIDEMDELVRTLDVQLLCPAHGLPVTQPSVTLPRVYEGVRRGAFGQA